MNSNESSRSWPRTMMASADVALRERAIDAEAIVPATQAAGWDPGEVWLSRIKRPRDRAAMTRAAEFLNPTS